MNRFEGKPNPAAAEALVVYGDAEFTVARAGSFVRCAVTGEAIPLEDLRYWSVDRQEAYVDVAASVRRERTARTVLAGSRRNPA